MFQVSRVMLLNKTLDILMIILRLNIGWIFHLKIISTEIVREECALLYTLSCVYLHTGLFSIMKALSVSSTIMTVPPSPPGFCIIFLPWDLCLNIYYKSVYK